WHADVTAFLTTDKVKQYIYVVIDNFSRKILSWLTADSVSAGLRKTTIEEALENLNAHHHLEIQLTDGGPENEAPPIFSFTFTEIEISPLPVLNSFYSSSWLVCGTFHLSSECNDKTFRKKGLVYQSKLTSNCFLMRSTSGITKESKESNSSS